MSSRRFQRITPFLWFDTQAEEAAQLYTRVFPNSRITTTVRYGAEAAKASGQPAGSVMTVAFELDGMEIVALNGGPIFKLTPAFSMAINCTSQDEIDHYWNHLGEGGDPKAQQCGWLKDRFGLSWQVNSTEVIDILTGSDPERAQKTMAAVLQMKKIDIAAVRRAAGL
jgi:predicted 3-demethylubiquinone-9 3-methyltransferase (glyoxalase superfamily)